jgi:hypothetical protein
MGLADAPHEAEGPVDLLPLACSGFRPALAPVDSCTSNHTLHHDPRYHLI